MAISNTTTASSFPPDYAKEHRVHWILIPVTLFTFLVPILIGLRFWARRVGTSNGLKSDDWTCLGAMIFALVTNGIFIGMTRHGFGRHSSTVDAETLSMGLYLFWFGQMTYKISLQLTKISLLLLYMRIFGHITWFRRTAISLIVILIMYTLASCMTSLVQCTPISAAWTVSPFREPPAASSFSTPTAERDIPTPTAGKCIRLKSFFIFNGAFALASDLIVLIVPLPLIYSLNPARHQKLALLPLFALGIFIVVISSQRLFFLATSKPGQDDLTYDLLSTVWTIIEFNLGIVCACLPIVRVWLLSLTGRRGCGSRDGDGSVRIIESRSSSRGTRRGYFGDDDDNGFDLVSVSEAGGFGYGYGPGNGGRECNGNEFLKTTSTPARGWDSGSDSDVSLVLQTPVSLPPEGKIKKTVRYHVEYGVSSAR